MRRDAASERGDIVLGWLTRVIATLAVVALIAFDSVAVLTARLGVSDDAQSAAEAANTAWNDNHGSVQAAYNAAAAYAEEHGEECPVKDFSVTSTGVVKLRLTGKATTLVVGHIGPLKKLAAIHGAGQATTPAQ
jgi:hypothetical protein